MSYELHQKTVPLKIYDSAIMTHKEYRRVAEYIMAEFDLGELHLIKWLDGNTKLVRNHVYGHQHWICLRNDRIVGLTVGHSGWMNEKPKWEEAGFKVTVDGVGGWRYLIIGPKKVSNKELREFARVVKNLAYSILPTTFVSNAEIYQKVTGRTYFKRKHWDPVEEKLRLIAHNPRILDGYTFVPYPPILINKYTVFFFKSQETKATAHARVFSGFRIRLRREDE